ncbi:MAG: hypothetical protein HYX66_09570 [Ignavibacteria bacterium]|nr:hypothetical protein [Ignavibacteria bacterium]
MTIWNRKFGLTGTHVLCVIVLALITSCSSSPSKREQLPPQASNVIVKSDVVKPVTGEAVVIEDTIEIGPGSGPVMVQEGKAVKIVFNNFDPTLHRLSTTSGDSPGMVKLEVVGIDDDMIKLDTKCQVVNVYGQGEVPRVRVPPGITPEQIVVTPIVNDNCEIYGYQVRYGSVDRGCKTEAKEVLLRFQKCFGKPPSKRVRVSKTVDMDCVLFGDCK